MEFISAQMKSLPLKQKLSQIPHHALWIQLSYLEPSGFAYSRAAGIIDLIPYTLYMRRHTAIGFILKKDRNSRLLQYSIKSYKRRKEPYGIRTRPHLPHHQAAYPWRSEMLQGLFVRPALCIQDILPR